MSRSYIPVVIWAVECGASFLLYCLLSQHLPTSIYLIAQLYGYITPDDRHRTTTWSNTLCISHSCRRGFNDSDASVRFDMLHALVGFMSSSSLSLLVFSTSLITHSLDACCGMQGEMILTDGAGRLLRILHLQHTYTHFFTVSLGHLITFSHTRAFSPVGRQSPGNPRSMFFVPHSTPHMVLAPPPPSTSPPPKPPLPPLPHHHHYSNQTSQVLSCMPCQPITRCTHLIS